LEKCLPGKILFVDKSLKKEVLFNVFARAWQGESSLFCLIAINRLHLTVKGNRLKRELDVHLSVT
jgi:hypothetical protein